MKSYFDEDYHLGDRRYSIAAELEVDVKRVVTWWANRKIFLKMKGIDIPRGTPSRPETYTKIGLQIDTLNCL